MTEVKQTLLMDAIHLKSLPTTPPHLLLKHVLSMPVPCPGSCSEMYAVVANLPEVLEIELGRVGHRHLACLHEELKRRCTSEASVEHLRTDGDKVWTPE